MSEELNAKDTKIKSNPASNLDTTWLDDLDLHGPGKNFVDFCKTEIVRRSNTSEDFDSQIHKEAIEMVLRKLGAMDTEKLL